jgi:hypothetical protein
MREVDVGSQSADTVKLSLEAVGFEMASGLIRPATAQSNGPSSGAN